jgi:hypothetical protein
VRDRALQANLPQLEREWNSKSKQTGLASGLRLTHYDKKHRKHNVCETKHIDSGLYAYQLMKEKERR